MELSNIRTVPLPRPVVWAALNDPAVLKDCLPGCESLEPDGEHAWRVVMAARVGPVSARFNGRMSMAKMADDFFARFVTRAAGPAASTAAADVVPADDTATPIAPAGGSPWIRYVAIVAIAVVLIVLYVRGYR